MTITDRAAERSDPALVLVRPSKITRDEIAATGMRSTDWVKSMQCDLAIGAGRTVLIDDQVAAVLTWRPFTPENWVTSFAATQRFFTGIRPTLYFRKLCRRIVKLYPTITFTVTSRSQHPQAGEWLATLGVVARDNNYQGGLHVL